MQEIDVLLDTQPTLAEEFVELDIRNKQAHAELQSYNETKTFLGIHGMVRQAQHRLQSIEELRFVKRNSPDKFIAEITNLKQNIRRISSNIHRKKYKDEAELKAWTENLERAKIREEVIKTLIAE